MTFYIRVCEREGLKFLEFISFLVFTTTEAIEFSADLRLKSSEVTERQKKKRVLIHKKKILFTHF